jgi:sigma-B regulation protein RsbU (phosphoserine phosphatase)
MNRRRILVVDDEPGMLRAVRRVLEQTYEVVEAESAADALAALDHVAPDLALVDVRMPGMDGFELSRQLQARRPDLDLILMTGSVTDVDRKLVRAIRQKVFYFIQKPFDREVLQALVGRCLELRGLAEENRAHVERLEAVLAEARGFQAGLFPRGAADLGRVRIAARHLSCDELCGDFYDYTPVGADRAAFLVADVSGHGASAAMLTGVVKSAFRSCQGERFAPEEVVSRIAAGIRTFRANRFVTLFCGLVDAGRGTLRYVNAGHPAGLLRTEDGRVSQLAPTGMLVSPVFERASWEAVTVPFGAGDRLLVYTDGIPECQGEEGTFGDEPLERLVAGATGEALVEAVIAEMTGFLHGRPRLDDVTLLTVSVAAEGSP